MIFRSSALLKNKIAGKYIVSNLQVQIIRIILLKYVFQTNFYCFNFPFKVSQNELNQIDYAKRRNLTPEQTREKRISVKKKSNV